MWYHPDKNELLFYFLSIRYSYSKWAVPGLLFDNFLSFQAIFKEKMQT